MTKIEFQKELDKINADASLSAKQRAEKCMEFAQKNPVEVVSDIEAFKAQVMTMCRESRPGTVNVRGRNGQQEQPETEKAEEFRKKVVEDAKALGRREITIAAG